MTKTEFNKYLVDIDLKIMNLWFKTDADGKPVLDRNGNPINEYFQATSGTFGVGEGWFQLLHDMLEELMKTDWDKDIHQVKEKFGGLRFYIGSGSEEVYDIIGKYEALSYKTCETCGETGELHRDLGWWRTLCKKHHEELKKEKGL